MQIAARSCVTAAAALAAGSMIGVAPAMLSFPDIQAHRLQLATSESDIAYADPLLELQYEEQTSNATLFDDELIANEAVTADGLNLEGSIPVADADAVSHLANVGNLFFATGENYVNGLLGVDAFDPAEITSKLLLPAADSLPGIDPGQLGGVEGTFDQSAIAYGDAAGAQSGVTNATALAVSSPADLSALLTTLVNDEHALTTALISGELAFNANLLDREVDAEIAAFGDPDGDALNGIVNQLINIDNLYLSTAENSLNSLLGANSDSSEAITASLLTGGGNATDAANVYDQYAALLTDAAGLTPTQISDAFAPGAFDTTAFDTAISGLIDTTAFSAFEADLPPMIADITNMLLSAF